MKIKLLKLNFKIAFFEKFIEAILLNKYGCDFKLKILFLWEI
jgi:hypothetical protein